MRLSWIAVVAMVPAGCGSQDKTANAPPFATSEASPSARPSSLLATSETGLSTQESNSPRDGEQAKSALAPSNNSTNPCMMQTGKRLRVAPSKAMGTEPFWSAQIDGRCVTYSHPSDQQGTRVWTRYVETGDGATWSGALGGQLFELRTRVEPGCSDGMSDKNYPLRVELKVHGEQRTGCAELAGSSAQTS